MNILNIFKSGGIAAGIIFGLIICWIIFKFANSNHKAKTDYDERQKEIRGNGYQAAFYTLTVYEAVMVVLSFGDFQLPVEPYIIHAAGIFLSCTVLACYCVWKGAYWGLNNNRTRYYIFFVLMIVFNAIPVIGSISRGGMYENGKLSFPFVNLMAVIMLAAIGIVMLLRNSLDQNSKED